MVDGGPAPKWVLVVDDEAVMREVWRDALHHAGYRTLEASTGREALDRVRAVMPDLMLLDLRMPGTDGEAVLRELAQDPTLHRVPVLTVSGDLNNAPRAGVRFPNVVGRLLKPVTLTRLVQAVQDALAERARQTPPAIPSPSSPE